MAAYVLAFSLLPNFMAIESSGAGFDFLGFASLSASLLVLVLGVVSGFDSDAVRSRYLHDNAKELSELYHEYKTASRYERTSEEKEEFENSIRVRYNSIMARCPFNHDEIDYDKTVLDIKRDESKIEIWQHLGFIFNSLVNVYLWPFVALAVPILLLIQVFI